MEMSALSQTHCYSRQAVNDPFSCFVLQMANDSTETSEAGEEEEEHEGDNDNKERMPFIQQNLSIRLGPEENREKPEEPETFPGSELRTH